MTDLGPNAGRPIRRPTDLTRFFAKVDITDTCWNWTGYLSREGYGNFRTVESWRRAHRVAYAIWHGYTPAGYVVMHVCDNRRCVNPDHLVLGSQVSNIEDCAAKGRTSNGSAKKSACKYGHVFTPENTRIWRGARRCLTCLKYRSAAARAAAFTPES